jgi:Caspase domain
MVVEPHDGPRRRPTNGWLMLVALLLLLLLPGLARPSAAAETPGRRVALVIGNSAYRNVPPLANPGNDARLLAQTLQAAGFKLVGGGARLDLDKAGFDEAIAAFGRAIEGADVALFYYSGHGMQVDGVNYLVPVSANPSRVQDLDFQMVNAELVLRQMSGGGTRLNIVILDACRNNPFGGRGLRGTGSGLAEMKAPQGTLISYATQPGEMAQDGEGKDSPFSLALADAMRQPGLDLLRLFNRVGLTVKRATGGQQQPWQSSSPLEGDFYFSGSAAAPPVPAPAPAPVTEAIATPAPTIPANRPVVVAGTAKPPPAPQAPAEALAFGPPGGFHCPHPGTVWTATFRYEAVSADPVNPHICRIGGDKPENGQLFNFYNAAFLGSNLPQADQELSRLFRGEADEVSFHVHQLGASADSFGKPADRVVRCTWRRVGRETVTIGNTTVDAVVFRIDDESEGFDQFSAQSTVWFDPATSVFVKEVRKVLVATRSLHSAGWSGWAHNYALPDGWLATSITLPGHG